MWGSGDGFDCELFGEYEGRLELWVGEGAVSDGGFVRLEILSWVRFR